MNFFLKPLVWVSLIAVVWTISFASASNIAFSDIFTDSNRMTFERVAERIEDLDSTAMNRVFDRIDTAKMKYMDYPAIVSMLDYIKHDAMMDDVSIAWLAMANDELSILVDLVVAADLAETLMSDDMMLTVFAPTNEALSEALEMLDMTAQELMSDKELLRSILLTHVVDHTAYSDQIMMMENMAMVETLEWTKLTLKTTWTPMIDNAGLIMTDMVASNGVVHVIDHVLLPDMLRDMSDRSRTIADLAMMNDDTSILLDLVKEAWLAETLMDEDSNLTVFAPTNQAFLNYLEENDMNLSDVKNNEMLGDILMYHIIPGSVNAVDVAMMDNMSLVETLEWTTITLQTEWTIMINNAMLVETDMYANNGIVHTIDTVLKPGM